MNNKLQKATVVIAAALVFLVTIVGTSREQVVVEANKVISDSNNIDNSYLIGSETLENSLSDKNLVILDIRSSAQYDQGHIPGAINVTWDEFVDNATNGDDAKNLINTSTTENSNNIINQAINGENSNSSSSSGVNGNKNIEENNTNSITGNQNSTVSTSASTNTTSSTVQENWTHCLNKKELTKELQSLGIKQNSEVVIYGNSNGDDLGELGKFSWMFRMIGINSKMLNGGFKNWEVQGFATTTKSSLSQKSNIEIENFVNAKTIDKTDIQKSISKIKVVELVNNVKEVQNQSNSLNSNPDGTTTTQEENVQVDSPEQSAKEDPPVNGVIQIKLSELLNPNGTIKPVNSLQNLFEEDGIKQSDIILFYNTDKGNLAFLSLIMNMAGYKNIENCNASLEQVVALTQKVAQSKNNSNVTTTATSNSNNTSQTTNNINVNANSNINSTNSSVTNNSGQTSSTNNN